MATFYFNGAVDGEWTELGNWWQDSVFSVPATSLPTSIDNVIATASITSNSGSEPTVANFTLNGQSSYHYLGIALTVTGNATFNDSSSNNGGTVNGNAVFNDGSVNNNGIVNGDANFTSSSFTFNPVGSVTGTVTFSSSVPVSFAIGGSTWWDGDTTNWIFTTSGQNWTFNNLYNGGIITGPCIFNNASENSGTITDVCIFNDNSSNNGIVTGNATFYDWSVNNGDILGVATFNNYSNNAAWIGGGIFNDNSSNDFVIDSFSATFNDYARNNQFGSCSSSAIFNDYSYNQGSLVWSESTFNHWSYSAGVILYGIFNDSSYNNGEINTDAVFNNNSYNSFSGYIYNNGIFNHNSYNSGTVSNTATFNDASYTTPGVTIGTVVLGTRTPYPLRYGINNSNILGMI